MEKLIFKHFQEEHEKKMKLYICEDNIDTIKHQIAQNQGEVDDSTSNYLSKLEKDQKWLEENYNQLVDRRNFLQNVNFLILLKKLKIMYRK